MPFAGEEDAEDASSQAKTVHVSEEENVVDKVIGEGNRVLKYRSKTLVPRSRVGLKRTLGSQKATGAPFEYDVSSEDEVVDPTTGVRRQGVGCLFSRAPKQFMTGLLTDDDLRKLGDTKLERKVRRFEKHRARAAGYGYGLAIAALQERKKRKMAEKQVKALRQEKDALIADMDLLQEDAEAGFTANRKRLEDQVKVAVNKANCASKKLGVMGANLKDDEIGAGKLEIDPTAALTTINTLSERVKLLEEHLAAVPSQADVVRDYKATPMYKQDLEDAVTAFRASRDFTIVVGAESRKITPLVVECCREFLKDDLRRPRNGFEIFFVDWMRARKRTQTRGEPSTHP